MQITTPTTVAQAIAPLKKLMDNLNKVKVKQASNRKAAEAKIAAAAAALARTEKVQGAVVHTAKAETIAADALLLKMSDLINVSVDPIDGMEPPEKMTVGHKQTEKA